MTDEPWVEGSAEPHELPRVEVQIYRHTTRLKSGLEFLETLTDDRGTLGPADLQNRDKWPLTGVCLDWTRVHWGGGDYQFRFHWRDVDGERRFKTTRNVLMAGESVPKRSRPPTGQEAPDRLAEVEATLEKGSNERIGAAVDQDLLLALVKTIGELKLEMVDLRTRVDRTNAIELATAIANAVGPLLAPIVTRYAQPKPVPGTPSLKESSTDRPGPAAEAISSAWRYRRRPRSSRKPRSRTMEVRFPKGSPDS